MADKKISQLTAASTPVAGTEVLPIVQSSTTVKVSIANLTAGRATNGLTWTSTSAGTDTAVLAGTGLTVTHAGGSTSFATFNQFPGWAGVLRITSSATEFGINSSLPFAIRDGSATPRLSVDISTGNTTVNTGNLVVGTAAKGIDFSANTHAAGMTSELLNWYEEGTWTPTLTINTPGDLAITYSSQVGYYTRIGRLVSISFDLQTSAFTHSTATGVWRLAGLPFLATSNIAYRGGTLAGFQGITKANYTQFGLQTATGVAQLLFVAGGSGQAWDYLNPADLPSGGSLILQGFAQFIL